MAEKRKKSAGKPQPKISKPKSRKSPSHSYWKFLIPVLAVTFALFIPALQNGFTNWDDILYVTHNVLLKDLSFDGLKAIFSTPVVSNYHPLTILSLAFNYQVAELSPMTWHLTSILLHVINTGLVFWFIWLLSSGNAWVSAAVALLFGIHPMHVESVAWISERKDLLYTMFYVGSMILYIDYVRNRKLKHLVAVTILGALSLLCKPAAIVLPLSLLALDYYLKRDWSAKWLTEKIPLFVLSAVIAYVTLSIQSERAVASVELHGIVERICYAGFGSIWYLIKLIVPYPLSALHPFPKTLSIWYYLATAVSLAGTVYMVMKVRNRNILFGFGFYIINLLLVLQLISIGNAVVAERYTYVPYISIFFMLAMVVHDLLQNKWKKYRWAVLSLIGLWVVGLAYLTWTRIPVWQSSQALWENVLEQYPHSARAWTNKGLDLYDQKKWPEVIEHLTKAIAEEPQHADALEWRSRAYLESKKAELALQDATTFLKYYPQKEAGLFLLARAQDATGQSADAVNTLNQLIAAHPDKPEYINNRGVINFNKFKKYAEAKQDFERAIKLSPDNGSYYLNLSRCYYMENDVTSARIHATKGIALGAELDESYAKLIGVKN